MQNGSHIVPSSPPRPSRPAPAADPMPPLTRREEATIAYLSQLPREQILKELKENLQTAIWIELATIPIYLFTYYSIARNRVSGESISPGQLFANRAGGVIMSVAVEEMLHMSLAGNVLHALGGDPALYLCSPGRYPASLPYHRPRGPRGPDGSRKDLIPLAKLSFEQLWHFLQIEYAEKRDAPPQDRNWDTIGQFYSYIRCLILCPQLRDEDFQVRGDGSDQQQIQPFNYSPNNVDTVYPRQAFDPWGLPPGKPNGAGQGGAYPSAARAAAFTNAGDSHAGRAELITVASKR
ncbi:MAG TPA: ferritin-like domain-containing protein, partial [Polyangiaceae bacterium]|nr:ferritin-like domain-containing protein [Polyangiaceae bacterium]